MEYVVAGRGQSIGPHASVVLVLVGRLAIGRQADDDLTRSDAGIVNDFISAHSCDDGTVHNDGADQVAHIRRLAARGANVHAVGAQIRQYGLGTFNEGRDDFAWNAVFVSANGAGKQNGSRRAHTEEVIDIHNDGVLGNSAPDREVARLLPVHVGQGGFCTRTIGVHHQTMLEATGQVIRDNFTEGLREEPLVYVRNGLMYIFFARGHPAACIPCTLLHTTKVRCPAY